MQCNYPCYNADSSAMIGLKDNYPETVPRFRPIWDLLRELVSAERFFICEQVAAECEDREDELTEFIGAHPQMVLRSVEYQEHLAQFVLEPRGREMAERNRNRQKDPADPYVIVSALALDGRDPLQLAQKLNPAAQCLVLQQEKWQGGPLKIPRICHEYGIACVTWPELLQSEDHDA